MGLRIKAGRFGLAVDPTPADGVWLDVVKKVAEDFPDVLAHGPHHPTVNAPEPALTAERAERIVRDLEQKAEAGTLTPDEQLQYDVLVLGYAHAKKAAKPWWQSPAPVLVALGISLLALLRR